MRELRSCVIWRQGQRPVHLPNPGHRSGLGVDQSD